MPQSSPRNPQSEALLQLIGVPYNLDPPEELLPGPPPGLMPGESPCAAPHHASTPHLPAPALPLAPALAPARACARHVQRF